MARMDRLQGCYQRVLISLLVAATVIFVVGVFLYQKLGGFEGARHWMAERALNGVEAHLLKKAPDGNWMRKPDGVSEAEIHSRFKKVREVNADRQMDLIQLEGVLREYQSKFQKTKPSTGEVIEFLNHLESTILSEDKRAFE